MTTHPLPDDEASSRSRLFVFLVSCAVMFPWPIFCFLLFPTLPGIHLYLMPLIGAFVLLFELPLSEFERYLIENHDGAAEPVMFSIAGLLVLMWIAILCLPLLGHWKRYVNALWLTQSIYAAAQAICAYFFLERVF